MSPFSGQLAGVVAGPGPPVGRASCHQYPMPPPPPSHGIVSFTSQQSAGSRQHRVQGQGGLSVPSCSVGTVPAARSTEQQPAAWHAFSV